MRETLKTQTPIIETVPFETAVLERAAHNLVQKWLSSRYMEEKPLVLRLSTGFKTIDQFAAYSLVAEYVKLYACEIEKNGPIAFVSDSSLYRSLVDKLGPDKVKTFSSVKQAKNFHFVVLAIDNLVAGAPGQVINE